jgi:hypothetical protein
MDVTLRPATGVGTWSPERRRPERYERRTSSAPDSHSRLRRSVGRDWTNWAAERASRYGLAGCIWDSLAPVLRQATPQSAAGNAATFVTNQTAFHMAATWAPVLRLHLAISTEMAWPPTAPRREVLVTRLQQHETGPTRYEQELITRIFARYAASARAPEPAGFWETPLLPPARVVLQPGATDSAPIPSALPAPSGMLPVPHYREDPGRLPSEPADIEQLTNHVLHSIDQRVVAARERLGKR